LRFPLPLLPVVPALAQPVRRVRGESLRLLRQVLDDPLVSPALGKDVHPGIDRAGLPVTLGRVLLVDGDRGVAEGCQAGECPRRLPWVELDELLAERFEHRVILGDRTRLIVRRVCFLRTRLIVRHVFFRRGRLPLRVFRSSSVIVSCARVSSYYSVKTRRRTLCFPVVYLCKSLRFLLVDGE
jgi:hypothetical protein